MKATRGKRPAARRAKETGGGFFTLGQAAGIVGGSVAGDGSLRLSGIETLERAAPEHLSWLADSVRSRQARESRAGALLVASAEDAGGKPSILVSSPTLALAVLLETFRPRRLPRPGVSKRAHVHASARLGRGVSIAAGATIEQEAIVGARTVLCAGSFVGREAVVGEDCYLHPNAVVLERCRIGARCELHAGAVVGSDGFGYAWDGARHRKIPQIGIVRVEDDVEIGANATIDRATLGETVIGRGTKIDNLVQVGHNVVVGEGSILCGQAGIGGSSRLGRRVTLAGQVGVSDHATIGDGAVATGQAGIVRGADVEPGAMVSGMPAAPHRDFMRRAAWSARLPELARRLQELEREIEGLRKGGQPWKSESPKS